MRSICVYCGSSPGADPLFMASARALGRVIAETDRVLVYGGAKVGLMGALADSVLAAGGMVIGVVPHALVERLLRRLEDCNVTSVPKWIDRGEA